MFTVTVAAIVFAALSAYILGFGINCVSNYTSGTLVFRELTAVPYWAFVVWFICGAYLFG